jgi:hypothetical protein
MILRILRMLSALTMSLRLFLMLGFSVSALEGLPPKGETLLFLIMMKRKLQEPQFWKLSKKGECCRPLFSENTVNQKYNSRYRNSESTKRLC